MRFGLTAAALAGAVSGPAMARDPFSIDLTVGAQTGSRGFTTLEDAYNALSTSGLRSITDSYTETSATTAALDLRGVPALATYGANSPVLRVQVPGAGIDETFNGATREESRKLFQRWLEGRGGPAVDRLLRTAVRSTPIDPIAGNPNSALTGLAASDFNAAVDASFGERSGAGVGARFGSFTAAGYDSRTVSLPIDYAWQVSPRDTLQVDVPLAYTDTGGAASYSGNVGLLYRRRVTDRWTLQPSVRVGGAGSIDLGSGSGVYGLGLNSTLRLDLGGPWRLTVANGLSYVSTFPVSAGRYSIDYNIANTVFRNGVVVTRDLGLEVAGRPLTGSAFVVDTRFAGSPVFVRNFQEIGVFVSAGREARGGIGLTMMTGDRGLFGVTVNGGVKF